MIGGAVAEGDLHSSILQSLIYKDKEKEGTGLVFFFSVRSKVFCLHIWGSAETSVYEHGEIFIGMLCL